MCQFSVDKVKGRDLACHYFRLHYSAVYVLTWKVYFLLHKICGHYSAPALPENSAVIFTSAKEVMFLPEFVCLSVCVLVR